MTFTATKPSASLLVLWSLFVTDTDPCDSNPCLNGGVCTSLFGYFLCSCKPGYGGRQCNDG